MKINNIFKSAPLALALPVALAGCSDGGGGGMSDSDMTPSTYAFTSRFTSGASSVDYAGQSARHVLIADMKTRITQLQAATVAGTWNDIGGAAEPTSATSLYDTVLNAYYRNGGSGAPSLDASTLLLTTTPARLQNTYGAISTGRRLSDKIAGADSDNPYYVDWSTSFIGFAAGTTFDGPSGAAPVLGWNPGALVEAWLGAVSANAYATRQGTIRQVTSLGAQIDLPIYVDASGRDYQQLLEKFLIGSVAFSQLADDYLDDAQAGKGLNSSNAQDATNAYSVLEHAWDEGYGYYGGSRDHVLLTDAQITARASDANMDSATDLRSEYNFGWARNAAVRDAASCPEAPTDFSGTIGRAFIRGRALISSGSNPLTPAELASVAAERNIIVAEFEKVIAASAIHYINELADVQYADANSLDFLAIAVRWSEMKGFLLSLQFNPRSPFAHTSLAADADFVMLHQLVGDAPEFDAADVPAYVTNLRAARTLLQSAYGFAAVNVQGNGSGCVGF